MPKHSKTENTNGSSPEAAEPSAVTEPVAAPKKAMKSAKSGAKKTAAKKSSAKAGAKKSTTRKATKKTRSPEPSDDDIRLRAYFLAERRVQMSIEGDPAQDWLDARQQLIEEFGQSGA